MSAKSSQGVVPSRETGELLAMNATLFAERHPEDALLTQWACQLRDMCDGPIQATQPAPATLPRLTHEHGHLLGMALRHWAPNEEQGGNLTTARLMRQVADMVDPREGDEGKTEQPAPTEPAGGAEGLPSIWSLGDTLRCTDCQHEQPFRGIVCEQCNHPIWLDKPRVAGEAEPSAPGAAEKNIGTTVWEMACNGMEPERIQLIRWTDGSLTLDRDSYDSDAEDWIDLEDFALMGEEVGRVSEALNATVRSSSAPGGAERSCETCVYPCDDSHPRCNICFDHDHGCIARGEPREYMNWEPHPSPPPAAPEGECPPSVTRVEHWDDPPLRLIAVKWTNGDGNQYDTEGEAWSAQCTALAADRDRLRGELAYAEFLKNQYLQGREHFRSEINQMHERAIERRLRAKAKCYRLQRERDGMADLLTKLGVDYQEACDEQDRLRGELASVGRALGCPNGEERRTAEALTRVADGLREELAAERQRAEQFQAHVATEAKVSSNELSRMALRNERQREIIEGLTEEVQELRKLKDIGFADAVKQEQRAEQAEARALAAEKERAGGCLPPMPSCSPDDRWSVVLGAFVGQAEKTGEPYQPFREALTVLRDWAVAKERGPEGGEGRWVTPADVLAARDALKAEGNELWDCHDAIAHRALSPQIAEWLAPEPEEVKGDE